MRNLMWQTSAAAMIGLMLIMTGCGGTDTNEGGGSGTGGTGLRGTVKADGSSTVGPISIAVATKFRETYPDVDVTVGISGTGGGFEKFQKGETDISDASRPIKAGEFDACKSAGINFIEVPVAYDGLTIVVNKKNDWVDQMTVEDLIKIFRTDVAAKTWKEVNDAWPDEPIDIFAPGTQSGTFDYFKEVVVPKKTAPEGASIRSDINASEDDNQLVTGVAGNEYAIGFFGVAYYTENTDKLRAVPIVNPETGTAVVPDADKIESGEYAPFSRPLFIYVKEASLDKAEVLTFVEYYLDNATTISAEAGYVALPTEVYDLARQHLAERISGTHFLDTEGESRHGALPDLYKIDSAVGY